MSSQHSPLNAFKTLVDCHCKKNQDIQKSQDFPFITLSRQSGAGGTSVARKLEEMLNIERNDGLCPWHVFDKDLAKAVIEEHRLPDNLVEHMEENKVSEIKDILGELAGIHPPHFTLVKKTSETIAHLAKFGNAIIVGRGANYVTGKFKNGLHVRLIGSLKKRIKHTEEFFQLSTAEATKKVAADDKARAEYLKQNFDKNIDDVTQYDLIINTDNISFENAAKIIMKTLQLKLDQ